MTEPKPPSVADFLRRVDSISNFVNGFETNASAMYYTRPKTATEDRLSQTEIDMLYMNCDLARRIVDEIVDDALRSGWKVFPKDGKQEISREELEKHPDPTKAIERAWKMARRDGGAAVLMVSGSTRANYASKRRKAKVVNLVELSRAELSAQSWDNDLTSPDFSRPSEFSISWHGIQESNIIQPIVHTSHMLRFEGEYLDRRLAADFTDGWGDSVLQPVWITLRNFLQAEAAIAEILARFETPVYSIAGLAAVLDSVEGERKLAMRIQDANKSASSVGAILIDKDADEDYERKFANVNGLDTLWDRLAHSVSKASKMPMTQLFGMSPSGQSTDDEAGKANWRKQVARAQNNDLRPQLERYYGEILKQEVRIEFAKLDELSPIQEAEVQESRARTRMTYKSASLIHPEEVRALMAAEGLIPESEIDNVPEPPQDPMDPNGLNGDLPNRASGNPSENNDPLAKAASNDE